MRSYYSAAGVTLYLGDSREVLPELGRRGEWFEACVTDPPYGLSDPRPANSATPRQSSRERIRTGFMGQRWDAEVPDVALWRCVLEALLPGGNLLAFGGTRTFHRLACAIEDAGFEVRDCLSWLHGQGFPKSLDVSKAIAKQRNDRGRVLRVTRFVREARDRVGISNAEIDAAFGFAGMAGHWTTDKEQPTVPTLEQWSRLRELLGFGPELDAEVERLNARKGEPGDDWKTAPIIGEHEREAPGLAGVRFSVRDRFERAPATSAAALWQGWGTALKPAWEPILYAMRPLEGTFAENALRHGVAGLHIDGARIEAEGGSPAAARRQGRPVQRGDRGPGRFLEGRTPERYGTPRPGEALGRWPANVALDEEAAALLDAQAGERGGGFGIRGAKHGGITWGQDGSLSRADHVGRHVGFGDSGGPSRFFYCAKAGNRDRGHVKAGPLPLLGEDAVEIRNTHPTVKPVPLMEWLLRLVETPTGGRVLDPFAGSGTTLVAAIRLGREAVGIEREERFAEIAARRLEAEAVAQKGVKRVER